MNIEYRTRNVEFRSSSIIIRYSIFGILCLCVTAAWGQSNTREPHIGYLYPGGGQQGTVIQISAGGQYLAGANDGLSLPGKIATTRGAMRNVRAFIRTRSSPI
jgi:hypothetical protein